MRGTPVGTPGWATLGLALLCLTFAGSARAQDVTTLSGQTLRQARFARLDPDGVTYEHSTGICKVEFTDLPVAIRQTYHYDPARAAAYKAAQAQASQKAAEQRQQDQRNLAAWRKTRYLQLQVATSGVDTTPTFSYHRDLVLPRAAAVVAEQADAYKAADARLREYDGTFYDRRLWAVPQMIFGHSDGHDFDPPTPESPRDKPGFNPSPVDQGWSERLKRLETAP